MIRDYIDELAENLIPSAIAFFEDDNAIAVRLLRFKPRVK